MGFTTKLANQTTNEREAAPLLMSLSGGHCSSLIDVPALAERRRHAGRAGPAPTAAGRIGGRLPRVGCRV